MTLLNEPIRRKLSALLGIDITFERMHLSLLRGTLDVHGLSLAGDDPTGPRILTVPRLKAELSLARALHKEISIRAITIERPVVRIVQQLDGKLNLPRASDHSHVDDAPCVEVSDDENEEDDAHSSSWHLDVSKALVVDGQVTVVIRRGDSIYELIAGPVLAELARDGEDFKLTLIVESVSRAADSTARLPIKCTARFERVQDVLQLGDAPVEVTFTLGESLRGTAQLNSIAPLRGRLEAAGEVDLQALMPFAPVEAARHLRAIRRWHNVKLDIGLTCDGSDGFQLERLTLDAQ
jgi:uncharacterized protein involved in outer membrane biogenesis